MKELTKEKEEQYAYLAKINLKAEKRQRITKEELEKYFDIAYNHGYESAKRIYDREVM